MRAFILALLVLSAGCLSQEGSQSVTVTAGEDEMGVKTTSTSLSSTSSTTLRAGSPVTATTLSRKPVVQAPSEMGECMLLSDSVAADGCFYQLAGTVKNNSVCGFIRDANTKLTCQARFEEDPGLCIKIDVLKDRDYCHRMMAFKWNNIDYCYDIKDADIRDKCLMDYVRDKKADPYVCFKIVDGDLRDDCIFYHVGLERINPQLCYLIYDPSLELECNETYMKS